MESIRNIKQIAQKFYPYSYYLKLSSLIKILYISLGENMHGTEKFIYYLIKNLPQDKFKAYWGIPFRSKLSEILDHLNIDYFLFDNGTLNGFKIRGLISIAKFIRKNKIDIVHSNSGILPCAVGKLLGVKMCFETRHGLFFTDEQLIKFKLNQKYHEKIKQYFVNYQIAISENDKSKMIKYFGMSGKNIKVIYNGIDVEGVRMHGIKSNVIQTHENRIFKFLNIGRFTYQKAQIDLLKVVNLLKNEYPNFQLTIIGEGEYKINLIEYIANHNLEKFVSIESYRENIHESMMKYDALVMTSRYEGVPFVVSDAMALGLPVIHTDVGGVSNVIRDGLDGIIVQTGNIIEIKDAMKKIATDTTLYENIQKNALKRIEEYSIQRMVNEYVKIYSQ